MREEGLLHPSSDFFFSIPGCTAIRASGRPSGDGIAEADSE